jgi:hypothetical protein
MRKNRLNWKTVEDILSIDSGLEDDEDFSSLKF